MWRPQADEVRQEDAAAILGVHRITIFRWCKDGYLTLGIGYLAASVLLGLAACYLGIVLARVSPFSANTAPR